MILWVPYDYSSGYGYPYDYSSGYGPGLAAVATAPLLTGRSVAVGGIYCATPVKTCLLSHTSWVGNGCSCTVVVYTAASLHYAVEGAARCYSAETSKYSTATDCVSTTTTQSYAKGAVVEHDDFHRQTQLNQAEEIAHQHGEPGRSSPRQPTVKPVVADRRCYPRRHRAQ
jgi:hypothetical protein